MLFGLVYYTQITSTCHIRRTWSDKVVHRSNVRDAPHPFSSRPPSPRG